MNQKNLSRLQSRQQFQTQWDLAIQRAAEEQSLDAPLGDMLTEAIGLYVKSGVEAGGLWGTTSCSCQSTCDCFPP